MVWGRLGRALLICGCVCAAGAAGCGGNTDVHGEARAGEPASPVGGTGGVAGAVTGGRPADSGGTSVAGATATAGTPSIAQGGAAPATAGAGMVSADAGALATGGSAGETAGAGALPSPGCALANAAPDLHESPAPLTTRIALPAGYDGVTPLPLLFDLHATNAGNEYSLFKADPSFSQRYILVGPEPPSSSGGSFESVRNVTDLLTTTLDVLLATLCVDQSRLFATGDGSGGRVLTQWVAARDKAQVSPRFRALAVVGTYYGKFSTWQPTPLLFAHALQSRNSATVANDEDGTKAFATLAGMNACGQASTPVNADRCAAQSEVVPGCVDLDSCGAPFRFCHYDGPAEEDVWPCFATAAVAQFFEPFRQ